MDELSANSALSSKENGVDLAMRNAAQWAAIERSKATRPFVRVVTLLDDRTNPVLVARHNLVLPVDDPFWNRWTPKAGAKCTLQSLSQRDVDRLLREGEKLVFDPPTDA